MEAIMDKEHFGKIFDEAIGNMKAAKGMLKQNKTYNADKEYIKELCRWTIDVLKKALFDIEE
jgi:hypothetical protein